MKKLPTGWVACDFTSVCQYIQRGKSPEYDSNNKYPIINQKCIRWNYINPKHLKFVTSRFWEGIDDVRFLQKGDILWNSTGTGTLGRAAIFVGLSNYPKVIVDGHVTVLRTHIGIDSRYLYYWIQSPYIQSKIGDMQSGTTNQIELSKDVIQGSLIYLAPENEQKRIANKLDQLFKELDNIKSRLSKMPIILKHLRQAIYNSAVTGKLSNSWRNTADVVSTKHLIEMIFNERKEEKNFKALFEEKENLLSAQLPKCWTVLNLDKICLKFTYGSSQKSQKFGDVPVLRMGNIQDGALDWEDLVYSNDVKEIEKYKLFPGDVLFNRTNSPELVGKSAIYRGEHDAIYAGYLIKLTPSKHLNSEYLNLCLNSSYAKEYCWQIKTDGVSQSNINAKKLGKMPIPLCSVKEQEVIVVKALELISITTQIEKKYASALEKVNEISQSILNKAFSGDLVPHDKTEEPASILLEKIKKQKENNIENIKTKTLTASKNFEKKKRKEEVGLMPKKLQEVLSEHQEWLSAQEAFQLCGIGDTSLTEEIETLYAELRFLDKLGQLDIDTVFDNNKTKQYDRLKLKKVG